MPKTYVPKMPPADAARAALAYAAQRLAADAEFFQQARQDGLEVDTEWIRESERHGQTLNALAANLPALAGAGREGGGG